MYSSHKICSVTCLRFSSQWIVAQSGSVCRRWPCLVPTAVEQPRFQRCVGQLGRQRPAEPRRRQSAQGQSHCRRRHVRPARDLIAGNPGGLQTKHFAHMAHRYPLCWHPPSPQGRGRTLIAPAEAPSDRCLPGRHHPGRASEIISERQATLNRNGRRHHPGFAGDFPRNQHRMGTIASMNCAAVAYRSSSSSGSGRR
jgi:hypothetical protein